MRIVIDKDMEDECLTQATYFNALDTYTESIELNAKQNIKSEYLDSCIETHYNNPSFGYGGYNLLKVIKQLLANCADVPQNMRLSIVDSNRIRKNLIVVCTIRLAGYYSEGNQ